MAHATEQDVKSIIDTLLDADEISPFLQTAANVVTAQLSGEGLSEDQLRDIEMWLGAHFVAIRDPRLTAQTYGDAQDQFETATVATGLASTRYGQTAISLDPSGKLAAIASRKGKPKLAFIPNSTEWGGDRG